MKNSLLLLIVSLFFLGCQSKKDQSADFYMPAEWKRQEAVWLGWEKFEPFHQPFLDIAKALYPNVPLKIIAEDAPSLAILKTKLTASGIDTLKVEFHIIKDNRIWMRDHGASYLINQKGQKKVADFGWTLYGNEAYLQTYYEGNKDSVAFHYQRNLAETGIVDSLMGASERIESIKTEVNMEGGSIEVNGKGTLILCETVTFQRNPTFSKQFMEAEFKRILGVSNIIWMKKGLVEDPFWFNQIVDNYYGTGTYGHTDEFVRFVNDSTILLSWVDEKERNLNKFNQMNYERLAENLAVLEKARDQDGKPFKIIKVPLPDLIYLKTTVADKDNNSSLDKSKWKWRSDNFPKKGMMKVGDTINWVAASSYLNYLITNNVVLLPSYLKEGSSAAKEARVKSIFTAVFPDRKLIFLNVITLNYQGGGIHCVTQQEPKAEN